MKRKIAVVLFSLMMFHLFVPLSTVKADTGPKPSVQITFENMGDELCYGTLLSKEPSTGPATVWDGNKENIYCYDLDREIWQAFVDYKDSDGYYFLQRAWLCSEEKVLDWTYYPPTPFKILLYYPKTNTFVVSDIYERYAFDSKFKVDMAGIKIKTVEQQQPVLVAEKSYDYTKELIALACRILITIFLEIGIAFFFGFGHKKYLMWIAAINVVTQIILNVLLNILNYNHGQSMFIVNYILFEFIVFFIEAIFYSFIFNYKKQEKVPIEKCVLYSMAANGGSYVAGVILVKWFAWIF